MIVIGHKCYSIFQSDTTAVVNIFTDNIGTIEVPIRDVLIIFEDI